MSVKKKAQRYTREYKDEFGFCRRCGSGNIGIVPLKKSCLFERRRWRVACSTPNCESTWGYVSVSDAVREWKEYNTKQINEGLSSLARNSNIQKIFSSFSAINKELFIVGGSVRDFLLGRPQKDIDFTTNATPEDMRAAALKMRVAGERMTVIPTGEKFGTLSFYFPFEREKYEITTFRKEGGYRDYRHPSEVVFGTQIEEDLARRDFSCNAIAWSPSRGIVDPYNGISDIRRGVIKCVGNPDERFREDPLRILRLIRFALRYGFQVETNTLGAALTNIPLIAHIAKERIGEELKEIFDYNLKEDGSKDARKVLKTFLFDYFGITEEVFQSILNASKKELKFYFLFTSQCKKREEVQREMNKFALGTEEVSKVAELLKAKTVFDNEDIYYVLSLGYLSRETVFSFFELIKDDPRKEGIEAYWNRGLPTRLSEIKIDGNEIKEHWHLAEGQKIGKLLDRCLRFVVQYPWKNTKEDLYQVVEENLTEV